MSDYQESTARPLCGYCGMPTTSVLSPYICERCRRGSSLARPQEQKVQPAIVARCVVCAWSSVRLLNGEGLGDRIGITSTKKAEAREHSNATSHDVTVSRLGGSEAGLIEAIGLFCPVCRTPMPKAGEWCSGCTFRGFEAS